MTYCAIYLIVSFVAAATSIFAHWYEGNDQTIEMLITTFLLSLLPLVNVMMIIINCAMILFYKNGTVVLKGKKR